MNRGKLNVSIVLAAVWLFSVAAWLLLRDPEIRNTLLALVPHRLDIPQIHTKQMLAPRSIFYAGLATVAITLAFLLIRRGPGARASRPQTPDNANLLIGLFPNLPLRHATVLFLALLQLQLVLAIIINYHLYTQRTFGRYFPDHQQVLSYTAQPAWEDAQRLKQTLPPGTSVALVSSNEFSSNLLASFLYPITVYDCITSSPNQVLTDPHLAALGVTHLLHYDPPARVHVEQLKVPR